MQLHLLLETATQVCSVALSEEGKVVGELHSNQPNAHSSLLSVFINDIMGQTHHTMSELSSICVSSGPGSYTGLRIGVSTAKGLCYARQIPLLSVPTLQSMASQYFEAHPDYHGLVCPMIDARRMECYSAFYARDMVAPKEIRPVSADVIESGIYDEFLNEGYVTFVGDGAQKTLPILGMHPHAIFDDSFQISASGLNAMAMSQFEKEIFEDVAYFEPFYLKDFVAKKSVVRGLR